MSQLDGELAISQVPTLGQEATIEWTVVSHHPYLKDATLTIELPKGVDLVEGSLTWKGDLTAEAKVSGTIKIKPVLPGNKNIVAVVFAQVDDKTSFSDISQLFFFSDKDQAVRGRVLDVVANETDTVNAATGEKVHPTKLVDYRPAPESQTAPVPCDVGPGATGQNRTSVSESDAAATGMLTVTGKWHYYDRNDADRPLAWVQVQLLRATDHTVLAESWIYDKDGLYIFPAVNNPNLSGFKVKVKTYFSDSQSCDGNPLRVIDNNILEYVAYTSTCVSADGTYNMGTTYIANGAANEPAWWVMMDLVKCFWWPYAYKDHTQMPGGATVQWYVGSLIGDYCNANNIYLSDAAADVESIPMHEYGHAVQWDIYGQWLPTTTNCNPHFVDEFSSANCAWVEGFASWYKCVVSGDPAYRWPGGGSVGYEDPTWDTAGWDDGEGVEGRVTGAMWDMGDSVIDGYDTCQLDWGEIWDVVYGSTHRDSNFFGFWDRWKSLGKPMHHANKALYQNTIDYNTLPSFSGLPDLITNEDTPLSNAITLWFYALDSESSDSELEFTISGNTNSDCGVSISGSRYVNINPMTNWYGTSTVTVSCTDGIRTQFDSFNVNVTAVNDPPVIAGLPDRSGHEDTPFYSAIDLWDYTSDPETSDSGLTYTITANTNTSCGASIGSNRYVNIIPASNWNGYSDVTIRATDPSGLWSADTIRITINPLNDAPIVAGVPDHSINEDTPSLKAIDLWAYTSDPETIDSGLVYTITTNTNFSCGVSIGSSHFIDINPASNWYGVSDVTVRATDPSGLWDEDTFRITVNSVNDQPTLTALQDRFVGKNAAWGNAIDLWAYSSDVETPDASLIYTITANTSPNCGASIDTSDYVDINPTSGWTGYSDVTIRATDAGGLWAEDTFRIIVAQTYATIAEARANVDGTWVSVTGAITTARFSGYYYVEDLNRSSGIRINTSTGYDPGSQVTIAGVLGTSLAERQITPYYQYLENLGFSIKPLGMANQSLGGKSPNSYTVSVPSSSVGLYNVGLLVTTTGKVIQLASGGRFFIADGSTRIDNSTGVACVFVEGVPSGYQPPVGSYVTVTGISGASTLGGSPMRVLRPRDNNDIRVISGQ